MTRLFAALCLIVTLALPVLAPGAASAQGADQVAIPASDYATWESVAGRAESTVDAADVTTDTLEIVRNRIADFRDRFDAARRANSERIATLRGQIDALGAPPEDGGEPETPEIADRRTQLNKQLADLLAPVQVAQEAYTRAEGIIREIDTIIRARQQERLLALGPSPLNPAHWDDALQELGAALAEFGSEAQVLRNEDRLNAAKEVLPLVLFLTALGLLLLVRGRAWAARMGTYLRSFGGRGTGVWSFVVSLLRIALPLGGVFALTFAITTTGLLGERTGRFVELLPVWAGLLLGYRWLAERLYSRNNDEAVLPLLGARRAEARFYFTLLALLGVLRGFVEMLFNLHDAPAEVEAVIAFPIVVAIGVVLFRFGQLLRGYVRDALLSEAEEEDAESEAPHMGSGFARVLRTSGIALQVVAVAAPALTAFGYSTAGNALIFPTLLSIGALGLVLALQRFFTDILGWITGQGDDARESLWAILITFLLLLGFAPLLALIWGARPADLLDLWRTFLGGFQLGETRISPTNFMAFVVIFSIGYVLTRVLQNTLKTSVLPKTRIDPGGQTALVSGLGYIGIFLAALIAVTTAGIDLSGLAILAGALSVGIGFGLQNIVNNFVSGIILLIERPISEGDWIDVGGQMGYVRDISVRSTRIETFDRSDVIVPNSDLISGTVTNYTRGNTVGRVIVPVGVAYGTDTRKVESILKEIAEAHPMVLRTPAPTIVFQNFGASSLDFEIRAILRDVNWMLSVKSEMNHQIAQRFAEEGIEIPFPQQDIWLRNPQTLRRPPEITAEESDLGDEAAEPDIDPGAGGDADAGNGGEPT